MRTDTALAIRVHPEMASLQDKIDCLKNRLGSVIEKISLLRYRAKDILLALYAEKIGFLEHQLLCTQIDARILRRRIELLTAYLNRGAEITDGVLAEIEEDIDVKMGEWREKIKEQEEKLKASASTLGNLTELDRETQGRIKLCYRKLCKMLHPDIVGAQTDLYRHYWLEVQDAYSACDANLLECLLAVVEAKAKDTLMGDKTSLEKRANEVSRLERLIKKHVNTLAAMRAKPPFCYEALLQDEEWVWEKQQSLTAAIAVSHENYRRLEETLEFLIMPKPRKLH